MYNTKLFELISSLNLEEQKNLLNFLPSSTLTNYTIIHKLFDFLIKQLNSKKKENTSLDRRYVFQQIFPDETYNEHKINKLLSDGNKAIEVYIVYLSITKDSFYHKMALINFYQEKRLDKYFENETKQANRLLEQEKESVKKLISLVELHEKINEFDTFKNNRQADFQTVYNSIINYSQLAEIKYRNYSLINMNSEIVETTCSSILYKIHTNINNLLFDHNNLNDFQICYQDVVENKLIIEKNELKDCIIFLISIAIRQVHDGLENAENRLFDLYSFLIDNDLVIEEDNTITPAIYKNVTTIGLYLNQFDYIDNFIETYKNNLPEEVREDVYSYNKAHLLYYKKEYNNVLQLISTTKYKDVFYRLSSRVLLIKTYYALEKTDATYFDILNNSINAFKKYVYTNEELNEYYKTRYKNFIKSVLKLIQLKNDKIQIQKYIVELNTNKDVLEQKWLINKAEVML